MKWCVEPIKNPASLREIYIILEQRENNRRAKTSENEKPYSAQAAHLGINRIKNRYTDIYPYDHNRFILLNPIHDNDYINASWIQEPSFQLPSHLRDQIPHYRPSQPQTWIASQGPLRQTCYEFLSLCLIKNPAKAPKVIIQLTACQESGREKCAPYIPCEVGKSIEFKPYSPNRATHSSNPKAEKYRCSSLNDSSQNFIHGYVYIRVTLANFETGPIQHSHHHNHHHNTSPSSTTSNYFSSSFYRKNTLNIELFNQQPTSDSANLEIDTANNNNHQLISKAQVIHYECIEWPDRGVPDSVEPILELINSAKKNSIITKELNAKSVSPSSSTTTIAPKMKISNSNTEQDDQLSPILVHCSAGVGRTGTLIAIASFVNQLNQLAFLCPLDLKVQALSSLSPPLPFHHTGALPSLPTFLDQDLVAQTIDFLREQRVSMVQTEGQVEFVYKSVAHLLDSLL